MMASGWIQVMIHGCLRVGGTGSAWEATRVGPDKVAAEDAVK